MRDEAEAIPDVMCAPAIDARAFHDRISVLPRVLPSQHEAAASDPLLELVHASSAWRAAALERFIMAQAQLAHLVARMEAGDFTLTDDADAVTAPAGFEIHAWRSFAHGIVDMHAHERLPSGRRRRARRKRANSEDELSSLDEDGYVVLEEEHAEAKVATSPAPLVAAVPWVTTLLRMTYAQVAHALRRLTGYHEYQFQSQAAAVSTSAAPADVEALVRGTVLMSAHAEADVVRSPTASAAPPCHASTACVVVRGRRVLSAAESMWLYALLARLDLPLTPDMGACVRQLYLLCSSQMRWLLEAPSSLSEATHAAAAIHTLAVVAGSAFSQRLAHEGL